MRLDPDVAQELFDAAQVWDHSPGNAVARDRLQRSLVRARSNDLKNREILTKHRGLSDTVRWPLGGYGT